MAPLKDGVIKRGSSWSYVIRITDVNGISRPRWVGGFATRQEAADARDRARVAARRGEYVDRSRLTVEAYLLQWLDGHALEVKPGTRAGYEQVIRSYVVPHIGRMRLQAVRPSTLSTLYRQLLESGGKGGQGLSARTVEYTHAVLRKALTDAVRSEQILTSNPAERAKRPRKQYAGVREVWGADQLRLFLEAAEGHRLFAYFRLAAYTGARRGELLNLRWSDVRLEGQPVIWIRSSVRIIDGARVEGTPKGGRQRTVSLDAGTVEILGRHREQQLVDRERAAGSWVEEGHVFRMEIGSPIHTDTPYAVMRKVLLAYNEAHPEEPLPVLRLHDLRHVHATLLLKAGVPVHVVAARLGHADPAITLRVYAHVLQDQADEVADVFARAVEGL